MCGVVGLWNLDGKPIEQRELLRFTDTLAHRGPDGRGLFIEKNFGLGHRRLSILDLSNAAAQPMSDFSQRYRIVFNGEIYNFLELRSELQKKGHAFRTESDTEVILAAYAEWGEEFQLRMNGMWALAIWDSFEKKLFLSRDRFGVKPLHYFFKNGVFAFASEMKAFLALSDFSPEFQPEILTRALLSPSSIEGTPDCIFRDVHRLPGGFSLTLRVNKNPTIRRWWKTLDHLIDVPTRFDEQVENFREIFFDACKIRLRSDVPVATALSGGLDSSSVACALKVIKERKQIESRFQREVGCFVATFPGTIQDEEIYARQVAEFAGLKPHFYEVNAAEGLANADKILFHLEDIYDLPVGPWLIYREFRRNKVCISMDGHGGDELLGGYHHYPRLALDQSATRFAGLAEARGYQNLLKEMYPSGQGHELPANFWKFVLKNKFPKTSRFYEKLKNKWNANPTTSPRGPVTWLKNSSSDTSISHVQEDLQSWDADLISKRLYSDFHGTLLPTILRNFDRMSMAHGVEIRAPLLDWRLVTFAFSLPLKSKLNPQGTKFILREAMRGSMPENIRTRKAKVGFASPLGDWLKRKEMKEFCLDTAGSTQFLQSSIWNGPNLQKDIEQGIADQNLGLINSALFFLNAHRLELLFQEKKSSYQSSSFFGSEQRVQNAENTVG